VEVLFLIEAAFVKKLSCILKAYLATNRGADPLGALDGSRLCLRTSGVTSRVKRLVYARHGRELMG